jgi:hypothetical protein
MLGVYPSLNATDQHLFEALVKALVKALAGKPLSEHQSKE